MVEVQPVLWQIMQWEIVCQWEEVWAVPQSKMLNHMGFQLEVHQEEVINNMENNLTLIINMKIERLMIHNSWVIENLEGREDMEVVQMKETDLVLLKVMVLIKCIMNLNNTILEKIIMKICMLPRIKSKQNCHRDLQ